MDRSELKKFVGREWGRLAEHKRRRWLARVDEIGAEASLSIGDQLREHCRASQAYWPSKANRAEDLRSHQRLSELLNRASLSR